jgi:hypothetical protein
MFWRALPIRRRPSSFDAVVIAGYDHGNGTEGVIERVRRVGRRVEVRMLLSDGGCGRARVDIQDWNWLELRVGDIVRVTRAETTARSSMPLSA